KSLKQLDVSYEQLELGNTSIRDNIVLQYNSNIEAIKEAKRQIDLSKDSIDLSQQSFEMTSLSYENGDTTFSDLQSAQLSVSNAQLTLLQSQYSYVSALLDLEDQCTR
ncbi:MAG: TolC family protein, partial [Sphaerochaetaceae bacterium]|nr:TolC family protein [Sphaerochaetaceae bacterium]